MAVQLLRRIIRLWIPASAVIGFLVAGRRWRQPAGRGIKLLWWLVLYAGIILCGAIPFRLIVQLHRATRHFQAPHLFQFGSQLGAVLIFFPVLNLGSFTKNFCQSALSMAGTCFLQPLPGPFPVMLTLGCLVFLNLHTLLGIKFALVEALLTGLAVTIPLAALFERFVDQQAIRWSRKFMMLGKGAKVLTRV